MAHVRDRSVRLCFLAQTAALRLAAENRKRLCRLFIHACLTHSPFVCTQTLTQNQLWICAHVCVRHYFESGVDVYVQCETASVWGFIGCIRARLFPSCTGDLCIQLLSHSSKGSAFSSMIWNHPITAGIATSTANQMLPARSSSYPHLIPSNTCSGKVFRSWYCKRALASLYPTLIF